MNRSALLAPPGTARVASEARHLYAQLLPDSRQAVHVAAPPAPELEGVQASPLHLGGPVLEGYVGEESVDADRKARLPCGRTHFTGLSKGQRDSGARGDGSG